MTDRYSTARYSRFRNIDNYDDDDDDDIINLNLKTSTGFVNPSETTYSDVRPGYGGGETYDQGYSQGQNYGPQAGDNDPDVYDYDADVDYDEVLTDKSVKVTGTGTGTSARDKDSEMRVKTTSFDNGEGSTIYDPESGAYDQMVDYATGAGGYRHHRERMTEDGVYQARDVNRRGDGSKHVHREYQNPVTGTSTVRDYEIE